MARKPFGVTADVHLDEHSAFSTIRDGFNSRLLDTEKAMLFMADSVKRAGGDTLFVVGDWFHSRKKISVNTLHISDRCLRACAAMGVDVVAILGNHDLSQAGDANSISSQPFAAVWTKPGVVKWRGWMWGVIPWTDDPEVVKNVLRQPAECYFGHFGVADSKVGPSDFEMPGRIRPNVFNKTRVPVFLGHYHKPQQVAPLAWYVGSPLQLSWGESGELKRFFIVHPHDSGNGCEPETVPLKMFPKFRRVSESDLDKVRPQDFVEVEVSESNVRRIRNKIQIDKINASVVVKSKEKDVRPPRLDIAGRAIKGQLKEYVKYRKPPKGFTVDETVIHALTFMGDGS